jgi:glycosyltransferase involved in cell wall biosynthesis
MKILYLAHHDALAPRLLLEIKTLLADGHEVKVIAWNLHGKTHNYAFPVAFVHRNSGLTFSQSLKKSLGATLFQLARFYPDTLKKIMESSWEVLHCCHVSLLPLAIMAKALRGGRVVYDAYEFHNLNISSKLKNRVLGRMLKFLLEKTESLCLARVDAVITIPSLGNQECQRFSQRVKDVAIILNVPPLTGLVRHKTFAFPPTAAYIGGLMREKGLFVMLEATAILAQSHPDFKLVLIGAMKEDPAEIERVIDDLKIRDHVILHDWVSPDKLGNYLSAAWIGLAPYQPVGRFDQETIGKARKYFDYMKQGLPVVAPSFGEIARVVAEENVGLLVDTTNPEALAAGIQILLDDGQLRQQMAANGVEAVQRKYNWEKEAVKLRSIYSALEIQTDGFKPGEVPSGASGSARRRGYYGKAFS